MNLMGNAIFTNKKESFLAFLLILGMIICAYPQGAQGPKNEGEFVVVLDAGHGGHDPGNLGNGYLEKNISLNIVLNVGKILAQTPNIKVVYTRKDDTFVDLFVRGEIANKANADLFVSIHCDSHSSDAHGAGTFVLGLHANKQNFDIAKKENSVIYLEDNYETRYADYDINSPESIIGLTIMQEEFLDQSISLAQAIQANFAQKLKRKDRQVKQAGFIVLHQTFMPSVLVETGFLTNDDEGAYLNSSKGQLEMGTAIAEAIVKYKNNLQPGEPMLATAVSNKGSDYDPYNVPKATDGADADLMEKAAEAAEKSALKNNPEAVISESQSRLGQVEKTGADHMAETVKPNAKSKDNQKKATEPVVADQPKVLPETTLPKVGETVGVAQKTTPKEAVKPAETVKTGDTKKNNEEIVFKVQLLASSKEMDLVPSNFSGLNELSKEAFQKLFRYMYGNTGSYEQAKLLKTNADAKGYTTSYIVAYKNGDRIPIDVAVKLVSQ